MEKKELIGRKVKGFAFEKKNGNYYTQEMVKYNGYIGTVDHYYRDFDSYQVTFEDGEYFYYPASLIEQHLITESKIDMELLDKFALVALPALIREASVNATEEQIANAVYLMAKAMLDERGKYEND